LNTPQPERTERVQSALSNCSLPPIGIHVTREELRLKRLHEISMIFESAFAALDEAI
jgi:hypothetical protein